MCYQSKLMAAYIFSILFMLLGMAQGGTYYYDFMVKETTFTRMCSTKSILTVNDSFPGPEIHVQKGDTVFVTVHNQGNYGVTIHWHGVKQPRNPWSDGPEYITQCPIAPGTSFTQEISLSDEEGTLWWHAHSDWSRATVHGAIIIHPAPGDAYPFEKPDKEQTIVLASWYTADLRNPSPDPSQPKYLSFTINGQPGDFQMCSKDSTYHMVVEQGKTYYLRVIGAVLDSEVFFGIANHSLTVVGMDGAYIKPMTVNWVMITPGQTMDILVKANQAPSNYYMAVTPFMDDDDSPYMPTNGSAIFQYQGNLNVPSAIPFPELPEYRDSEAAYSFIDKIRALSSPKYPNGVPKTITKQLILNMLVDGWLGIASINSNSLVLPKVDILQAYYKNISSVYTTDFPTVPPTGGVQKSTRVIMVEYGEILELIFQAPKVNHPMHLHGFSFYLVGKGKGTFNTATDPTNYNLDDPPLVNTIGVPKDGWAAIRFVADNPGVWFMHCHLERHSSWGMEAVLIVKDGSTKETSLRPPPASMPSCSP